MTSASTEHDETLDLLCELAQAALPLGLTPTERRITENATEHCSPGDIENGDLVPIHIFRKRLSPAGDRYWPANEIEVTYLRRPSGELGRVRVEILDKSDIKGLAQAFLWLLHRSEDGRQADGA